MLPRQRGRIVGLWCCILAATVVFQPRVLAEEGAIVFVQADLPAMHCSSGSGFFVSNAEIVTSYHVVQGSNRIRVFANFDGTNRCYDSRDNQVEIGSVAPNYDLALLRLTRGEKPPAVLDLESTPTELDTSTEFEVMAHPMAMLGRRYSGKLLKSTYVKSEVLRKSEGTDILALDHLDLLLTDLAVPNSIYGAPLFWNGQVLGVASGSAESKSGRTIGWAIPTKYLNGRANDPAFKEMKKRPEDIGKWPLASLYKVGREDPVARTNASKYTVALAAYSKDPDVVKRTRSHSLFRRAVKILIEEGYRVQRHAELGMYQIHRTEDGRQFRTGLEDREYHSITFQHEANALAQRIQKTLEPVGKFELYSDEKLTSERGDATTIEVLLVLERLEEQLKAEESD